MKHSKLFTRCMSQWLITLLLVMSTSLATRAASVEVRTSDVTGTPGSTVLIPVYVYCDVDITVFMINFSTDLGVTYSNVEFSDRIDPSANTGFGSNGNIVVANPYGSDQPSLYEGDGVVAEIYVNIPANAEPGAYTMTLGNMQFMAVGTSGSASVIYVSDVHATLTVASDPEAYACYTPGNTTLTFYYDGQRSSRTGTTYDLPTGAAYPGWYTDGTRNNVTQVVFDPSFADARPTTTYRWFYNMTNLQSITGMKEYLNTSEVTDMSYMFYYCRALTSLDLSGFNTANVTNMRLMFWTCYALTSLDVSSFNTSKVTDMGSMFYNCSALTSLDLSGFNTANVTDMRYMFYYCQGLTSLDLSGFNTANVTDMQAMFRNCSALTSLDVSSFNTANVTDMSYMFYDNNHLTTIYVGRGWGTAAVTSSSNMFSDCTRLVGGAGTVYDANHVDKTYAHIDGGPSNPGYFTEKNPEAYACYTPSNTTLTFYCDYLRGSRTGTTYDLNTGSNNPRWYNDGTFENVTRVVFDPSFADARPMTTRSWFRYMTRLTSITGMKEYLNTSEVTDMSYMFYYCQPLTSLDVSGFNTANVTTMSSMFNGCNSLTNLDVSGFNTSNVTDMSFMFYNCKALTSLDLSGFNTANVTSMRYMFNDCLALTSLDVSGFNTSNVTDMSYMFSGCESLTSLDVSSINTAKVTDMSSMFRSCYALPSLDLSSFNTAKVTTMDYMFRNCRNLTTIYAGNSWSTAAVTSSSEMFMGCTSLVGGQGTTYNASHVDKEYAHIDGGVYYPGYFSRLIRGDVNHDGLVNVADVTALIQIILNSMPVDHSVADLSGDGQVNVADVTTLIQMILNN